MDGKGRSYRERKMREEGEREENNLKRFITPPLAKEEISSNLENKRQLM